MQPELCTQSGCWKWLSLTMTRWTGKGLCCSPCETLQRASHASSVPCFLTKNTVYLVLGLLFFSQLPYMVQNIIYTGGNSLRSPPPIHIYSHVNGNITLTFVISLLCYS